MHNRSSKFTALAVGLISACTWLLPAAPAQVRGEQDKARETVVVTKAQKARGTGQDPNVKHKSDINNRNQKLAPPPEKAGADQTPVK